MGADIKNLRLRIKSIDSTLNLTNAMGLVAASKIRRATDAMNKSRSYSKALDDSIAMLLSNSECKKNPFVRGHDGNRTKIIIIAGDRGLAGGYNANIFRLAKGFTDAKFLPIGKRACEKYGASPIAVEGFTFSDCLSLAQSLCREFAENEFDRLCVISTAYRSVLTQEAILTEILPLSGITEQKPAGIIFEPDEQTVLSELIPEYVAGKIYALLKESYACEQASRRNAMDSAGKNAQARLDDLRLSYNRARQGAITQEITEIVAGSGQ